MSFTPPAGFGLFSIAIQDNAGGRAQFTTWGFGNPTANDAGVCNINMRLAINSTGSLYDEPNISDDFNIVQTYVLINIGGVLTSDINLNVSAGLASFNPVPPSVSGVLRKVTTLAGRQYRGRVAIPSAFLDESKVTSGGSIDSTVVSALQASADQYIAAATTLVQPLCLLHGPNKLGVTPVPTYLTALDMTPVVGSQRKRQAR